jgi:LytS/YehU family sensor histidine kinase
MLFMPFIENAIKYSSHTSAPFFRMSVRTDKQRVYFHLQNNFHADRRKFSGTNTGLSNTKKRLELMYHNRHELKITESDDFVHTVDLTVRL